MRNRYTPLIIAALIAVVLFFVVDDFISRMIIGPALYVAWFISVFISSMPQQVFWGIFLLIAVVFAAKSITREQANRRQTQNPVASQRGPVAAWASLLGRAAKQDFSRWRLAQALRRLTLETLGATDAMDNQRTNEKTENAKAALPPDIKAYFEAPMPSAQRLSRFWRPVSRNPSALDLDPETVVQYLEKELDPLLGD